jgi:outer membrane receptor protein involved in Fe transport
MPVFRTRPLALAIALMFIGLSAVRAQPAPEAPRAPSPDAPPPAAVLAAPGALSDVTVTGTREAAALSLTPAAVGIIPAETIRRTGPAHPSQLLGQVPGVAVAVTNGEGHTTAIRQPFTTAPVYLFLEDGIPIRPTGFFNHNALYETNLPQAGGVEIVRGPGSALYGSDAIGGIVNVLTRAPASRAGADARAEFGSDGWLRLLAGGDSGSQGWGALRGDLNLTHTDGWRDATAYDRRSGSLRWDAGLGNATVARTVFAFSRVDQQTGANSPLPLADFRDRPTINYRPIAYRSVEALRLSTSIDHELGGGGLLSFTPYVRDNSMDLLASFNLPSDPTVARTASRSVGLAAKWRQDWTAPWSPRLIAGIDLEASPGERREDRVLPTVSGTGATRLYSAYTLGSRVYDYEVTFSQVSPYLHGEISPIERLRVTAGLRWDRLGYRLDNRIEQAAVRDATSGAWYGQVADTSVSYTHLSPKLGATWAFDATTSGWVGYSNGFRAPSESQLFRPSVATSAANATQLARLSSRLQPIEADQIEIGLRGRGGSLAWELVGYRLDKRDDLVSQRDLVTNVTTTVNAGRTRHQGVEVGLGWTFVPGWRLDGALSYASHRYVDWVTATADFSGKEIESAPQLLGSVRLGWQPVERGVVELEWTKVGAYWLEAGNTAAFGRYDGHSLWNLRAEWPLTRSISVYGRAMNLTDTRWADSASVSSATAVYSPGLPRSLYAGIDVRW